MAFLWHTDDADKTAMLAKYKVRVAPPNILITQAIEYENTLM